MKTSLLGVKAIAKREGTVLHVYLDSKKLPTAGVGHLLTPTEKAAMPVGTKITQKQSDDWLTQDLKEAEDAVNSLGADLKQNEFDALVSLAFNIGVAGFKKSTVARRLKAGDKKGAANAILLWNRPPEIQGRRRTEYNQFLTPYKDSAAAPLANIQTPATDNNSGTDSTPSNDPPPMATSVEETKTEAVNTGDTTTAIATTVKTEQPKGDPVDAAPTQVAKGKWFSYIISGFGGAGGLATALWGWAGNNLNAVGIGLICLTLIILALMFRKAILDAIRMQAASDPDRFNVK